MRTNAREEHRVGNDVEAFEIDQDGGMAEQRSGDFVVVPGRRRGDVERLAAGFRQFGGAFAKEAEGGISGALNRGDAACQTRTSQE